MRSDMKIIKNIKNLFKVYDILRRGGITIDVERLGLSKDKWYYVSAFIRRDDTGASLHELSIFQHKTKGQAKTTDKKLKSYYKLIP